ncbi:hypothetical protein GLW04_14530 [Halobacillus litoralis]|uniref:Uncharacterized protein n=1 Tax=Halobacillus litoralis TaxID=45668 RepID=A0A845E4E9_9BACI|nr:hypothetical protein [Halobacillus litoralis]MYL21117.1 hypothetical protein [Halobacillus litoralis]
MDKIERIMKPIHKGFATLCLIYLLLVFITDIVLSPPILFAFFIVITLGRAGFRQSEGRKIDAAASLSLSLFFLAALVISLT